MLFKSPKLATKSGGTACDNQTDTRNSVRFPGEKERGREEGREGGREGGRETERQ